MRVADRVEFAAEFLDLVVGQGDGVVMVMLSSSDVDGDVADRRRLMHSWTSVSGSLFSSPVRMLRVQPLRLDLGAGEADAHPAAVLGRQAGGLGLLQQGRAVVLGRWSLREAHAAGRLAVERDDRCRRELLGVQRVVEPAGRVVRADGLHQPGRAAQERLGLGVPGRGGVEVLLVEQPVQVAAGRLLGVGEDERGRCRARPPARAARRGGRRPAR